MEIMKASEQWANRPADQRFWTLSELHAATLAHRDAAVAADVRMSDMRVEANSGAVQLVGSTGATAELTHWAFGQMCQRAGAPAGYLRQLPATLAVQNINHGLKRESTENPNATAQLLLHKNGGYFARAVLSDQYARIWNADIVERLRVLESDGWVTPPARPCNVPDSATRIATAADAANSLTVKEGDVIGPAGLYASFEDMFVFLLHPERVIRDGSPDGLIRGALFWNSEVGKLKFGCMTFYFRGACGNHIIWNASEVKEIGVRHVGNAEERAFSGLEIELKKYMDASATDEEQKIEYARRFVLKGKSKEDVVNFIFQQRILTRTDAARAYDAVVPEVDGDPYTAWGYAQGITRMSQSTKNADARVELDRAAGKVLQTVAF